MKSGAKGGMGASTMLRLDGIELTLADAIYDNLVSALKVLQLGCS
jgi:hypothetical protein